MKVFLIITILIIIGTNVVVLIIHYDTDQQPSRGVAMEDLIKLFRPETKQLGAAIINDLSRISR